MSLTFPLIDQAITLIENWRVDRARSMSEIAIVANHPLELPPSPTFIDLTVFPT
jgi:hypothetical protein